MRYKMHDMLDPKGIIHIQLDRNKGILSWDFPLGSPYDLCAVFDRQEGKSLRELQIAGARPALFHRTLKTSCHFSKNLYCDGFLLFPARVKDGVLDIGNQTHQQNAIVSTTSAQLLVSKARLTRRWFRERIETIGDPISISESDVIETTPEGIPIVYYQILVNGEKRDIVHVIPISSDNVHILLSANEDVAFYKDYNMTQRIEKKG